MNYKTKLLPKVSIIILSFNGENYLVDCLSSIRKQNYPKNKIEIVVVDNGSKDKSVEIARKFKCKVLIKPKTDIYENWVFGMKIITGDFVYMVDQDIELRDKNFIKKMVRPLFEDESISGSYTRAYPNKKMSWINRYLSYQPSMCDPLYEFLTPSIQSSVVKKNKNYELCVFNDTNINAESRMLYRLSVFKKTPNWKAKRLFDHDILVSTVKLGFNKFAYVPAAGFYHYHAKDFRSLLRKRVRNLKIHFFPYQSLLQYKWVDSKQKKQVLRLFLWVIYANLFFPAFLKGVYKTLKYKDVVLLMEPMVVIIITDFVLFSFLTDKRGRKIVFSWLKL
ncbi:MAG TPA: glycosyltransferase family 2 protein [Patescibacteria group bacterium]|nr:glycosyltransferase family 2 protein [Patescibacteria group bacterium]